MFGLFRKAEKVEGIAASILIIEDNWADRLFVQRVLEKNNYLVFPACNGEEGLNLACRHKIDLIILDHTLPGMSGLEICRILKQDDKSTKIPIIFLTVVEGREILEFYTAGAELYLHKPVTTRELLKYVQIVLSEDRESGLA